MIQTEFFKQRNDGTKLYRTFSDENFKIERDGILYDEAIDPEGTNREYNETNILIEEDEEPENDEF